jgi:hypothetical protein
MKSQNTIPDKEKEFCPAGEVTKAIGWVRSIPNRGDGQGMIVGETDGLYIYDWTTDGGASEFPQVYVLRHRHTDIGTNNRSDTYYVLRGDLEVPRMDCKTDNLIEEEWFLENGNYPAIAGLHLSLVNDAFKMGRRATPEEGETVNRLLAQANNAVTVQ